MHAERCLGFTVVDAFAEIEKGLVVSDLIELLFEGLKLLNADLHAVAEVSEVLMHSVEVINVKVEEGRVSKLVCPGLLLLPALLEAFFLLLNLILIQTNLASEGFELFNALLGILEIHIFVNV